MENKEGDKVERFRRVSGGNKRGETWVGAGGTRKVGILSTLEFSRKRISH